MLFPAGSDGGEKTIAVRRKRWIPTSSSMYASLPDKRFSSAFPQYPKSYPALFAQKRIKDSICSLAARIHSCDLTTYPRKTD